MPPSPERKPRATAPGRIPSPLAALKRRWIEDFGEADRHWFWTAASESQTSWAEIRHAIAAQWGVSLKYDSQISMFKDWAFAQWEREQAAARMEADEAELQREHPEWSLGQLREEVLKRSYARAIVRDEPKLGLSTIKADATFQQLGLEREKFERETAQRVLDETARRRAEDIASSNLSNADKIAAMRRLLFSDIDALETSGQVAIPQ